MARGPKKTILVIDDDKMTLSLVTYVLEEAGYKVEGAGSGPAAMRAIARSKPDLVLLDIGMGKTTGYDLLERIRAQWGDSPRVVALTARTANDPARPPEATFSGWIEKPFDVRDFVAQVERHLASL